MMTTILFTDSKALKPSVTLGEASQGTKSLCGFDTGWSLAIVASLELSAFLSDLESVDALGHVCILA